MTLNMTEHKEKEACINGVWYRRCESCEQMYPRARIAPVAFEWPCGDEEELRVCPGCAYHISRGSTP